MTAATVVQVLQDLFYVLLHVLFHLCLVIAPLGVSLLETGDLMTLRVLMLLYPQHGTDVSSNCN